MVLLIEYYKFILETRKILISDKFNTTFRQMFRIPTLNLSIFTTLGLSIAFLVAISTQSCSSKTYPEQEVKEKIEFGHGGGFAGKEHRFVLLNDGRLFSITSDKTFISRLPSVTSDQLFTNLANLNKNIPDINEPGNTYSFIQFQEGENNARWVWNSSNQATLDSQLNILHSILMKFTGNK